MLSDDTDKDGIKDGAEDADKDGLRDTNEWSPTDRDTDDDDLDDGAEDADKDGVFDTGETNPLDMDSDDNLEVEGTWCYVGEAAGACGSANHNLRMTSALDNDTDDDGLLDGQETGMTSPGVHTDVSRFRGDLNAATRTDPMEDDTDGDGILDGTEDLDRNGRVDSSEADPLKWDTDGDGLCDGLCSGKGEDQDKDGVRDQNADGDWTETDFLANDSDVDGVLDGAEVNGTYCFKGGSCANTGHPLQALNPDTDGDGLRDGQELAGWMVGIWYERTMEKKENYSVTSDPWDDNSDSDALTDFEEFMNGSDPRKLDTDGDQISDTQEITLKSNITGIEGTPPQILDVQLKVELVWRANTACLLGQCVTLYTPDHLELHVTFTVTENVGIDFVQVRVTKLSGVETQKVIGSGSKNLPVDLAFGFGLFEALLTGADVNITAYDVNGNGAWGEFHVKSVVEAVVEAIVALFSAIAKVIVEAASAAIGWILDVAEDALNQALDPIVVALSEMITTVLRLMISALADAKRFLETIMVLVSNPAVQVLKILLFAVDMLQVVAGPWMIVLSLLLGMLMDLILPLIISAILGQGDPGFDLASYGIEQIVSPLESVLLGRSVELSVIALFVGVARFILIEDLRATGEGGKLTSEGWMQFLWLFLSITATSAGLVAASDHTIDGLQHGILATLASLVFTGFTFLGLLGKVGGSGGMNERLTKNTGAQAAAKPGKMLLLKELLFQIVLPIVAIGIFILNSLDLAKRWKSCLDHNVC